MRNREIWIEDHLTYSLIITCLNVWYMIHNKQEISWQNIWCSFRDSTIMGKAWFSNLHSPTLNQTPGKVLTRFPGGPGGPASPDGPDGPCGVKFNTLTIEICIMFEHQNMIFSESRASLTGWPASPSSPLSPGRPSSPYVKQDITSRHCHNISLMTVLMIFWLFILLIFHILLKDFLSTMCNEA